MATVQLSKIQLRRGLASDLPGAPITLSPLAFSPSLDDGELGFTNDSGRLFIGLTSPTNGLTNYQRSDFPYQNIEVLTENSPSVAFRPVIADNRAGFFNSTPLTITASPLTFQTIDANAVVSNFHLDLPVSGVNASIWYYVFGSNHKATRQGVMHVVWNSSMVGSPVFSDAATVGVGSTGDLVWSAHYDGTNVVLQYINQTGDTPTVYFRIERPLG